MSVTIGSFVVDVAQLAVTGLLSSLANLEVDAGINGRMVAFAGAPLFQMECIMGRWISYVH